jgi:hypothetical protein
LEDQRHPQIIVQLLLIDSCKARAVGFGGAMVVLPVWGTKNKNTNK